MFRKTAELYDLFYAWKDHDREAARLHEEIRHGIPDAQTLLDVACGTGTHLERLRTWYQIEGLDRDAELLAVARARLGSGVPLHEGDMRDFHLGREFDVVTCLFSSIGYVRSLRGLHRAVKAMAEHLRPGGLLLVEPWFTPDTWHEGHLPRPMVVEGGGLNAVRTNSTRLVGRRTVMDFHYLVTRPDRVEHLRETHDLGLFTTEEYRSAFERAHLVARHDDEGLMGRGLWIAQSSATRTTSC
ncbi:MAG: class I SAM-dependent methyltransferase [Chloroflexota bacterium]|nr:class I SAM-dependent methyltransferase [Chloroflexota bacterium]